MTEHERLMLRRHLERAARAYEAMAKTIEEDLPVARADGVRTYYSAAAAEARDFATRLRTKTL